MAVAYAVVVRKLQFVAGPGRTDFHACAEHRGVLESRQEYNLHYVIDSEPVRTVDEDDEIPCDVCRGEDGP